MFRITCSKTKDYAITGEGRKDFQGIRFNEGEKAYIQVMKKAGANITKTMEEKIDKFDKEREYFKKYKKKDEVKKRRLELKKEKDKMHEKIKHPNCLYKNSDTDKPKKRKRVAQQVKDNAGQPLKKKSKKGCNCKSTHCSKGRCACFSSKRGCGVDCKCQGCENPNGTAIIESAN